jgi:hypothetical protein
MNDSDLAKEKDWGKDVEEEKRKRKSDKELLKENVHLFAEEYVYDHKHVKVPIFFYNRYIRDRNVMALEAAISETGSRRPRTGGDRKRRPEAETGNGDRKPEVGRRKNRKKNAGTMNI